MSSQLNTQILPPIHIDALDVASPAVGIAWMIGPNELLPDLLAVTGLTMTMRRPDRVEIEGLPVTTITQTSTSMTASYAFRSSDLASRRPARIGEYVAYLVITRNDGKGMRSQNAKITVVERFAV